MQKKKKLKKKYRKLLLLIFLIVLLVSIFLCGYKICFAKINKALKETNETVSISYVGDLILLKDQVTYSYDNNLKKYNFDYMFEHVKKYFSDSDYSIGVFEGPIADEKLGYSTSNYGDGNKLYLGFPREFADAVKNSGIDLVTTANNHLMDREKEGVYNTLDYLDEIRLEHVGSYKSALDKSKVKVIDVKGVKIAVLAYTMGSNYCSKDYFMEEEPNLTSLIVPKNNKYFARVKESVKKDFERAKKTGADLIMVMPHMGTQFTHEANNFQELWNDIFASFGADIILGDHSHATQPVLFKDDTLIVNCPGNFANSYIKDDGDATAIVNFEINKSTKKVIGTSVVPMYTKSISKGKYQAVPIYDIYTNEEIYNSFSDEEFKRVSKVQEVVTESMLDRKIGVDRLQKFYYVANNEQDLDVKSALEDSSLKEKLDNAKEITFIGDSITHGTKNGLHGWQEALLEFYPKIKVNNFSHGSYTTKMVIDNFTKQIKNSNSDIYFIAIGTNDIRYRDEKICAMDDKEYIEKIDKIVSSIKNKKAKIVLIAPWMSLVSDTVAKGSYKEKNELIDNYSQALENYAKEKGYIYVNANRVIEEFFQKNIASDYLIDYIHPNSDKGIKLYSYAVLKGVTH